MPEPIQFQVVEGIGGYWHYHIAFALMQERLQHA